MTEHKQTSSRKLQRSLLKLFLILIVSHSSTYSFAAAVPKGAVKLSASKLTTIGNVRCGKIRNVWIAGRTIKGGYFYPRTAERSNLIKQARSASGAKKTKLLRQAATLYTKLQTESLTCMLGYPYVTPTSTATPTAIPTNSPSATATPTPTVTLTPLPTPTVSLTQISSNLFNTEHAFFIIPPPGQVDWSSPNSFDSMYSNANIDSFVASLKSAFPDDYFFVTILARNLLPDHAPSVRTGRQIANGIGLDTATGINVPNICKYNSGATLLDGMLGVLDHEIGHNWVMFLGSQLGNFHWAGNSTAKGQMWSAPSDDGVNFKEIFGDPSSGFTWQLVNSLVWGENETFSENDLYLQGLASSFPAIHVLNSPVYNSNGTVTHSGVSTYDQAWVESNFGVRSPSYRTSPKRFRIALIYVAHDLAEVNLAFPYVERSIKQFSESEVIDTTGNFRFQVPFLPLTKFRGSVDSLLVDMDGNHTPTLSISGASYQTTSTGSATFAFNAADADGTPPVVSCVPASINCTVSGSNVNLTGLTTGSHFFTIKAQDSAGKKTFAHFVVDRS